MLNLKLEKRDYVFAGLTVLSLIVSCVLVSPKKMFWNDELYSWYLLSDRSFTHMWQAFADKINNTPPLYFLLGWLWSGIFPPAELSLRLFSSLGFGLSLFLTWVTLRRSYSFWAVALAVIPVFATSSIILIQNAEARMYGLFMTVAAWCLWLFDRLCRREKPANRLLFWNFLAHAALIHTHLHGAFYSGAILVALILYDLLFSALRPRVYLSVLLGWLTFLLYLPAFLVQADAGKPRSWIPEPLGEDLTELLFSSSGNFLKLNSLFVVVFLLIAGQVLSKRLSPRAREVRAAAPGRAHLLTFGLAMIAVPAGVWLISRIGRPIFFPRYFMPTAIGYVIVFTHLFQELFPFNGDWLSGDFRWPAGRVGRFLRWLPFAVLYFLLSVFILSPIRWAMDQEDQYARENLVTPAVYPGLPVVVQVAGEFPSYYHYSRPRSRYYFILDEAAAQVWESGRFTYQEHKHMDALLRNYPDYFDGHIIESEDFLRRYDRFLVLDYLQYDQACPETGPKGLDAAYSMLEIHCPQWLEKRILGHPEYRVTQVGRNGWNVLLLVERQ